MIVTIFIVRPPDKTVKWMTGQMSFNWMSWRQVTTSNKHNHLFQSFLDRMSFFQILTYLLKTKLKLDKTKFYEHNYECETVNFEHD
jgi:hypothetical protein